ncbi:MAG TPA: HAMP domain-containing sensor histidine kinase [Gemmatimonadaceae bacterium]|nr:HAMP domain-containing sensor histidine kinase [Gemmatimonadaceae bacterium]
MWTGLELLILASVALGAWYAGRAAAQKRARGRTDVLSIVAHDLRNPLNLISSSSSFLLEQPEMSMAQRERMLQMTQRAVGQMTRLTSDLLDATRLQNGQLKLELGEVGARGVLLQLDESFRQAAIDKKIGLRIELPETDQHMCADDGRVLQALGNLVGNALKFTPAGGSVTVKAERCEVGGSVVFSVADTGPGMSAEDQRRVFDRFFQAREGDVRGVGLGLTITKGIVEAHGGNVWLQSTLGKGTTFYFNVPWKTKAPASATTFASVGASSQTVVSGLKLPFRIYGFRPELNKCQTALMKSAADSLQLEQPQWQLRDSA